MRKKIVCLSVFNGNQYQVAVFYCDEAGIFTLHLIP